MKGTGGPGLPSPSHLRGQGHVPPSSQSPGSLGPASRALTRVDQDGRVGGLVLTAEKPSLSPLHC